jgi:hypothetical protein
MSRLSTILAPDNAVRAPGNVPGIEVQRRWGGKVGVCVSRACGVADHRRIIGFGPDGKPFDCDMRGVDDSTTPDIHWAEWQSLKIPRTAYIAPPPITADASNAACHERTRKLLGWGFSGVAYDSAANVRPFENGGPVPAYAQAVSDLSGMSMVAIEGIPQVRPGLYPWAQGQFHLLLGWDQWNETRKARGYFCEACPGCFAGVIVWLQSSVPAPERVANTRTALKAGCSVYLDFVDIAPGVQDALVAEAEA